MGITISKQVEQEVRQGISKYKQRIKMSNENRIDIEKPYWDQNTFRGRALHFLTVTNPLNVFAPNKALEHARNIVTKYR